MLFKNIKTGNIVAVSNGDSVELMQRSPIYEAIKADIKSEPEIVVKPEATKKVKTRTEKAGV